MPTLDITSYCKSRNINPTAGAASWMRQRLSSETFRSKHNISRAKAGRTYIYDVRQLDRLINLYNAGGTTVKTVVEYIIQGNYGNTGWEDLCSYDNRSEAYTDVVEYRKSGYDASYRVIKRRVPNPNYNPNL
jgi:hypothetical protein